MYSYKIQVTTQKGIATLVAIALVLWAVGAHMFTTAEAANLTFVKNTLSDSAVSSVSNHTIQFTTPTGGGVGAGQTIVVTFPNFFVMGSVAVGDIDLDVAGADQPLAGAPSGATWGAVVGGQNVTFTSGTATIGANATVTISIGNNAVGGTNQVTNPATTTSYEFTITAGADSGQTRVAILPNVLVTASVDTILEFTVSGVANGETVNGSPTTTATTTTSTSLPFETLEVNTSKTLAQDLTVATNAIQGYVVTVEQDANLRSSTGADIDGFVDGNYNNTPTAWVAPSGIVNQENTYGHWGLTSNDATTTRVSQFTSDTWISASTTPTVIMSHNGPVTAGSGVGLGSARIGYQAQISALQEAGDDYNTTLTYIATPTF